VSNITLPRAVVWRLHAAFRDADKTIRPNGEKSDYSAEIAILDAAFAEPEKKTAPLPRITCGFIDVRFDGEGWFCAKCSERMPSNYEALVKHYSGERDYLKLMQRKAEAIRARGSK